MQDPKAILAQILAERPPVHTRRDGRSRCIGLSSDVIHYLYQQLSPKLQTLETGCGLSTLIFALAGCNHQAIVPNKKHIEETCKAAEEYAIDLNQTSFIEARSEAILPGLTEPKQLDVVLIDGGHAFPIPIIDWFYTKHRLVVGGLMILDDVHLKTVNILNSFLNKQPEWKKQAVIHKTVFFLKQGEQVLDDSWDYWREQPFNSDLSAQISRLLLLLRRHLIRKGNDTIQ